MHRFCVGFALSVASGVLSVFAEGSQASQGGSFVVDDELTLLQAAAIARSAASVGGNAVGAQTIAVSPVCLEEETHHDLPMALDFEVPLGPLVPSSTMPQSLETLEDAPNPSLVLVVRVALLILSFGFFANGATSWLPCGGAPLAERKSSAAKSAVDAPWRSRLHEAALSSDDVLCESLLLREPGLLAAADSWGTTALHAAATSGARGVAELFLEHGAGVDLVDAWDETPLHLAAREGHVEVCEILVKSGASLLAVNAEDMTPLVVAAHAGQEPVCKKLLSIGAGAGGLSEEVLPDMLRGLMLSGLMATEAMPAPFGDETLVAR